MLRGTLMAVMVHQTHSAQVCVRVVGGAVDRHTNRRKRIWCAVMGSTERQAHVYLCCTACMSVREVVGSNPDQDKPPTDFKIGSCHHLAWRYTLLGENVDWFAHQ